MSDRLRRALVVVALVLTGEAAMRSASQFIARVPPAGAPGGGTDSCVAGTHGTYKVGPGKAYTTIGAVPWYAVTAGDTVCIYPNTGLAPYHEKFLISGAGTAANWINVMGIPDGSGHLPIISGANAVTSTNNHYHYTIATGGSAIQDKGIIQLAVSVESAAANQVPQYIDISNLEVENAGGAYTFTSELGVGGTYDPFAACINPRSPQHLVIDHVILHDCGNGFFDWTANGDSGNWFDGIAADITIRDSNFYDNGCVNCFGEHQSYTQSNGVTIEGNYYGIPKAGMLGNQIKDRSVGTVIRYNHIEQSPAGYDLDLVEPQDNFSLDALDTYKQTFVYGNFIPNTIKGTNIVHWNEDQQDGSGRATVAGSKLLFYNNTIVIYADGDNDFFTNPIYLFNVQWGAGDCSTTDVVGIIDVTDNLIASIPRTMGDTGPLIQFGFCNSHFNFGKNWVTSGWGTGMVRFANTTSTGDANNLSPAADPLFVANFTDLHLTSLSTAKGIGGALASEVTSNFLGLDLTTTRQYVYEQSTTARSTSGLGSDAGAFAAP